MWEPALLLHVGTLVPGLMSIQDVQIRSRTRNVPKRGSGAPQGLPVVSWSHGYQPGPHDGASWVGWDETINREKKDENQIGAGTVRKKFCETNAGEAQFLCTFESVQVIQLPNPIDRCMRHNLVSMLR